VVLLAAWFSLTRARKITGAISGAFPAGPMLVCPAGVSVACGRPKRPMHSSLLRWFFPLALALPLRAAQTVVSNYFVFKGIVYEQTSSSTPTILADPAPHAPGPYYIDVLVSGTTAGTISPPPSFTGPSIGSTSLTATDSTRWDFKAGYSTQAALDLAYPSGTYAMTIPGFNSGNPINLSLTGNVYSSTIPAVTNLASAWSGNNLIIDANATTTLNFSTFSEYNASSTNYREILAFVPPTGSNFGQLAISAFSDPAFSSFTVTPGMLNAGDTYRVVLEYDIFSDYNNTTIPDAQGGAIYSRQTQFFVTAIPEPSTYAFIAGLATLAGAAWRRARRPKTAAHLSGANA
jgi:hypothetical protein